MLHRRKTALAITILWTGWWIFFGLSSSLSENAQIGGILLHVAVPGLVFAASTVGAWKNPRTGGALLFLLGLGILVGYPVMAFDAMSFSAILFVMLTMALPPLVAGVLYRSATLSERRA